MLDGFLDEIIARIGDESKKEDMLWECGECKNYDKTNHACKRFGINMNANDFCSYFEKKEEVVKLPEKEVAFLKAAMGLGCDLVCLPLFRCDADEGKIYFYSKNKCDICVITVAGKSMPYLYKRIDESGKDELCIKSLINENAM